MTTPARLPQGGAIAEAIETGQWDRLTWSLAIALARLLETLPPDAASELLTLLVGDDETAHGELVEPRGEPFDGAQGDRYAP